MDIAAAQADFDRAYNGGAAGVFVSGAVWLAVGAVWMSYGLPAAFATLFFGGMAIHPVSVLLAKFALRCPATDPANPLTRLAGETTFALIAAIVVAYALLPRAGALVIPAFALVVAARYFMFRTLYGSMLYWALGTAIAAAGAIALFSPTLAGGPFALIIGGIEIVFAVAIHIARRR